MKQKKLIFNFFVNRNWKKLTDSRKRAKILADNRKSHHPIETLFPHQGFKCEKCLGWVHSGFWSFSCLQLHSDKFAKGEEKTWTWYRGKMSLQTKANCRSTIKSTGLIYKNSSNDFIRKEFLNTDVKNTLECFKVLLNLVNVKTFTAALKILLSFRTSSRTWHQQLSTWTTRASTIWCISLFHDWLSRIVFLFQP